MAIKKLNTSLKTYAEYEGDIPSDLQPVVANMSSTAVIAHYNAAVELEH